MSEAFVPFDDMLRHVKDALGAVDLPENAPPIYVIRDMFGKIGLSVSEEFESDDRLSAALDRFAEALSARLGAHGRPSNRTVMWVHRELLRTLEDTAQELDSGVVFADRLMVGGGWWKVGDRRQAGGPRRYTLHSIKGGVGRSTTAAVLAWHLARRGEDVLVVDLDIESPGLAAAVLPEEAQPTFGVVDWFVEELVGQGDNVLGRMVATPAWAHEFTGSVWVVPAHGHDPGEYLAKLGRVYMDTAADPWTARLRRMLERLEATLSPTVVLIESRSGLHDIAAATVTDLDADVMLFAVDSPSNWIGYGILFDHWSARGLAPSIRDRLSMVSALTPELGTERYLERFRENAWNLFRDRLYDSLLGSDDPTDAVSYDLSSAEAPHSPLVIRWNRGLAAGTSLRRMEQSAVEQAYSPFLRSFDERFGYVTPRGPTVLRSADNRRDIETHRIALSELPEGTSHGEQIPPAHVYLPPSHRKALAPNVGLVTGIRGSGKTFWWTALRDPAVRRLFGGVDRNSFLGPESEVQAGFGVLESPDEYPTQFELEALINDGVAPRLIWRTIHARHLVTPGHPLAGFDSWRERIRYVRKNADPVARLFRDRDDFFEAQSAYSLVLFDGLDRTADRWEDTFRLIRGLLQHALAMRSYRRLRVKAFLRTDQLDERRVADFPDASKVLADSVELTWPRRDLYGMLWQCLANGPQGRPLRTLLAAGDWPSVEVDSQRIYTVPSLLAADEGAQRDRFHQITGPWMGTDHRRGFPYTWIPNHLADARGSVSPRSFLKALRAAAEDTSERHPANEYALHYDSIKRGVREASMIRVRELREDYPWVDRLLEPLSGVVVPCGFRDIARVWGSCQAFEKLAEDVQDDAVRLPPRSIEDGPDGVRRDLEELGVFRRLKDGRVDIPDVFRLGYRIGRKGGVRLAT